MMKIVLMMSQKLIHSSGGAEKVLCTMANEFARRGYQVIILTNDRKEGLPFYPLDERVRFFNFKIFASPKEHLLLKGIYKCLYQGTMDNPYKRAALQPYHDALVAFDEKEKPDLYIPFFLYDFFALTLTDKIKAPLLLMQHGETMQSFSSFSKSERKALKRAAAIQVLLDIFKPPVRRFYNGRIEVISNVVPQLSKPFSAPSSNRIVMVGRLSKDKNQILLLKSFLRLKDKYPTWHLDFYGEALTAKARKYEVELRQIVEKAHLEDRVHFHGVVSKVWGKEGVLAQESIFALSSVSEGFCLAATEAMSMGLPILGLKECVGVAELVQDGKCGLLAENNVRDFSEKLERLMLDSSLRKHLGAHGQEYVKKFKAQIIWDKWEKLIKEVIFSSKS